MIVTFADFEIRYKSLRAGYPDNPECSVDGCSNPVDVTEGMGIDTSCSYHRMLFDRWHGVLDSDQIHHYLENQTARRKAFKDWYTEMGKKICDKIVLDMAQEPINWMC